MLETNKNLTIVGYDKHTIFDQLFGALIDITANQALRQAIMNKSQVMGISDGAGLHLMSFNKVENMDGCIDEVQRKGLTGEKRSQSVDVHYDRAYFAHWEEDDYMVPIVCTIVNQIIERVEGLSEFLAEYGEAVRVGTLLPQYRDVTTRKDKNQQVDKRYNQFVNYFDVHNKLEKGKKNASDSKRLSDAI